jgi:hypothetical protein
MGDKIADISLAVQMCDVGKLACIAQSNPVKDLKD